jgi:hypothetical protein
MGSRFAGAFLAEHLRHLCIGQMPAHGPFHFFGCRLRTAIHGGHHPD